MSYLIWNIDDDAVRQACIEAAFFSCGWHVDDTLGEIIEQMLNEGGTPSDTETSEDFIACMETVKCGDDLSKEATSRLESIFHGAKPDTIEVLPITIREILFSMFDVEEWFEEMAD